MAGMEQKVYITGLGVVSAPAHGLADFVAALKAGRSNFNKMEKYSTHGISPTIGALIDDFSFADSLEKFSNLPEQIVQLAKKSASRSPVAIQVAVVSALEAWQNARLYKSAPQPEKIGLVIAGQNVSNNYQFGLHEKFVKKPEYLNPKFALHFLDTDHVGTISEILGLKGEGFTTGGASASGNVALIKAQQLIRFGILDACLVVGAMADLSPMDLQGFYNIGAYGGKRFAESPQEACRPFDKEHEGFIYGQASGCIILESDTSVEKREVTPLARLAGGAINMDANRMSDPNEEGEISAMNSALLQAGLTPADIHYINAHGSSSPLGDKTEASAFKKVFGEHISTPWINSTKGITGHCLYSAGVIEAIATVVQLSESFVHPSINIKDPIDAQCKFAPQTMVCEELSNAVSNSFGFGGINTSIILTGN